MIGHRGFGKSHFSFIRENTVLSFNTAHKYGIKYVEFDVQLSSEGVPVIFHDYFARINEVETPTSNLSLPKFRSLVQAYGVLVPEDRRESFRRTKSWDIKNSPPTASKWLLTDKKFPTLERILKEIPIEVGFNVEIKYPTKTIHAKANPLERNLFADKVLQVIFDHAGSRSLYFSSFDPDLCVVLANKQQTYPVFFLTEGKYSQDYGHDYRCCSMKEAIRFASEAGLQGIVSDSSSLLQELHLIKKIHEKGLLLFTYGRLNNDKDYVSIQKKYGVDAIISDKVHKVRKDSDVNEHIEKEILQVLKKSHSIKMDLQ